MNDQRWLKILVRVGVPSIVLIFYVTASAHFAYTPDATYVYLQFAKNILQSNGFAFNPGEETYGVSSPLWLLIVSAGGWVGVDMYMAAKALDLVFASLVIVALYILAFEVIGDHIGALCAILAFSVNIWFLRWAGTGTESSFAVLLLLLALRYCLRNEYFLAIVLAGLFTLTRPEGWLLLALILIDVFLNSVNKRRGAKMVAALVLLCGAFLIPWMVFAFLRFGTIMPNSMMAKVSGYSVDDFGWTLAEIAKVLAVSDGLVILLFLAGLVLLVRYRRLSSPFGTVTGNEHALWLRFHMLPFAWIFALPLVYAVTGMNVLSSYLLLIVPVVIVYAFALLWRLLAVWGKERVRMIAIVVFAAVILAQNQFVYYVYVKPSITAFSQGMEECFIPIGKWLKVHTPEDAVVFVPDAGAVGYHAERTICDAGGIVSSKLRPLVQAGYSLDDMMTERTYSTMCTASYVVHRSQTLNELLESGLEPVLTKVVFGMDLTNPKTVYYTVYKVHHSFGK